MHTVAQRLVSLDKPGCFNTVCDDGAESQGFDQKGMVRAHGLWSAVGGAALATGEVDAVAHKESA